MRSHRLEAHHLSHIRDAGLRYQFIEPVGRGRHGTVFAASTCDEFRKRRIVAVKSKSRDRNKDNFAEEWIHATLHHPNIVDLYHTFSDKCRQYMVMEFCHNGSLADFLESHGPLTICEASNVFVPILGAIKYIHNQNFIHGDLKAENVLFDSRGRVRIADFGLAALMDAPVGTSQRGGTLAYAAPEIITNTDAGYHAASDIWSIGVLLYFGLTAALPFSSEDEIVHVLYHWPIDFSSHDCYRSAISLVSMLLTIETPRCTPDEIVQHPFFSQGYYATSASSCFSPDILPATCELVNEDRRLYRRLCQEAGVGFDVDGREWPCQGRDEPQKPLFRNGWDVVDPQPWLRIQPCKFVDP